MARVSWGRSWAACLVTGCMLLGSLTLAQEATEEGAEPALRGSIVEDRAARKLLEAGDARLEAEEPTKAVEVWQSVIERYPRSRVRYDAHMRLGRFLLERERAYDRARTHFEAAAQEQNSDEEQRAEATLKLGVCFYEARNFGKTFQVMRDVVEKFPVSPHVNEAYYYIGLGHFQLGHYSRAIEALEKVGTALSLEDGQVEKVAAGHRLFVRIEDADLAALEPGEVVRVRCRSSQGDDEIVECYPVGRNVRIVLGSIVTALGRPYHHNGRLELKGDDTVQIEYIDKHTADRQFDRPVGKEVQVVGDAKIEITDGAFQEVLRGVVLDRGVNVQITDGDRDLSDAADNVTALIEVYREKTQEELQAEAVAEAAEAANKTPSDQPASPTDIEDVAADTKTDAAEEEARRFKLLDRIEIQLAEAKLVQQLPGSMKARTEEADPAAPMPQPQPTAETSAKPAETAAPAEQPAPAASTGSSVKKTTNSSVKATPSTSVKKPAADKPAPATAGKETETPKAAKPETPALQEPVAPPDDGTIHSGVFRLVVPLIAADEIVAGDDALQARPGDIVQVTYIDEKNGGEGTRTIITRVKCVEGNLGGVRVTRAQISDQELRVKTQLKTADALTNIGTRYKEFGLESNAQQKYEQALQVCEEIGDEAQRLGGRLLEETYVQLWKIYYEMGRLELAAAMSQRLQREFPNSEFVDDALLKLAEVSRKQGDLQRAIGIYNRLVEMPKSLLRGEAQYGIAECYEELANQSQGAAAVQLSDRSFQEYKKVFEQFPDSGRVGEAVAKMAEYYYKQKDYARAVDVFETVLNNHPDARYLDVILFNYGRCLYRMERKGDARRQFDQLISDYPESPLAADAKKISEALVKAGI